MGTPTCNCTKIQDSHDERCAIIRHVRGLDGQSYEPDLTIPSFLMRERRKRQPKPESVFD